MDFGKTASIKCTDKNIFNREIIQASSDVEARYISLGNTTTEFVGKSVRE